MGNTLSLLTVFAGDIGLEVVASVKALCCFTAGSTLEQTALLAEAESIGQQLLRRLEPRA